MGRWRDCTLGELVTVKHGFAFLGEYFAENGSHVVLTPGNFLEEGGFRDKGEKEKWYTGPIPPDYVLKEGDVLVAMTEQAEGLLGASALIPRGDVYLHNQRLGLLQVTNDKKADLRFVYHLFNHRPVRQQIRGSATGTKVRHTAPSRIAEVKVRVPEDVAEQKYIAAALSAYDDLIENCERRIRVLDEMARALYREWFVNFRYPGHEKVPLVDSTLGPVPRGWVVTNVSKAAQINAEQVDLKDPPATIRYIDISSVSPGVVESRSELSFADAPGRARRILKHGDVIWSCVRPNRRSHALVLNPSPDTIASTGFAVLSARAVPFTYLYAATTTDGFVAYLEKRATGAAYPAVTARIFEEAPILIPSERVLEAFGRLSIPAAENGALLRLQIDNLRRTRDLLLPRLLSGQLSVAARAA